MVNIKPEPNRQHNITNHQTPKTSKTDTTKTLRTPKRRNPLRHQTGTGGNAHNPIPTGGNQPRKTNNPIREYQYAKWDNLRKRTELANISPALANLIYRTIAGRSNDAMRRREQPGTLTIRIDFLTAGDWKEIDRIRIPKQTR
jgi:hypothetical protein